MRKCITFLFLMIGWTVWSQNFSDGFSWSLPLDDSTQQRFLPAFSKEPIDENDRIRAQGKHFYAGANPVRFWGVNITTQACFPDRAVARSMAARLQKMGVNLVRFHHVDNPAWFGNASTIFLNSQENTREFDPESMDRLDYFIAQLKQRGIYVNMNLNVTRTFRIGDGVALADSLVNFGKGVTLYDPQLQSLQREYAEMLLGHVNPYLGQSLADDPVLAMVEMNNENSLYGFWRGDRLQRFREGGMLTDFHTRMLDSLWHVFLDSKYTDETALIETWNANADNIEPVNLVTNAGLETGSWNAPWTLELHGSAQATASASTVDPYNGDYHLRLNVTADSDMEWHIQAKQTGVMLQADSTYQFTVWAKADSPRRFSVSIMLDEAPFTWFTGRTYMATEEWQAFTFTHRQPETVSNARITLSPLGGPGIYDFDAFQLSAPQVFGLQEEESLVERTIDRFPYSQRATYTAERTADLAEFYVSLQREHFQDFKTFLNEELNVSAPITGTNSLVGPQDVLHQLDMDYIDDHSYWDHPQFPGEAWDLNNWRIDNQPQVMDEEMRAITNAVSGLALANKPFTISEYNHGFPNRYRSEMPHLLAAYSAYQGVDGIMFYTYAGERSSSIDVVNNFFDLQRDHSVMSQFPAYALAYRQFYLQEAADPLLIDYSAEQVYQFPAVDDNSRWGRYTPYPKQLALTKGIATRTYAAATPTDMATLPEPGQWRYTTENEQSFVDYSEGLLLTQTPQFVSVTGMFPERFTATAGPLQLLSGSGFGSLSWVSLDGQELAVAERSLLTFSTVQQNNAMVWDDSNRTLENGWGTASISHKPELIRLRLSTDAPYIRLFPLNERGIPIDSILYTADEDNTFLLTLDQRMHETLWFGIQTYDVVNTAVNLTAERYRLNIAPNPIRTGEPVRVYLNNDYTDYWTLKLFNTLGQRLMVPIKTTSATSWQIDTSQIPPGQYVLRGQKRDTGQVITSKIIVQ